MNEAEALLAPWRDGSPHGAPLRLRVSKIERDAFRGEINSIWLYGAAFVLGEGDSWVRDGRASLSLRCSSKYVDLHQEHHCAIGDFGSSGGDTELDDVLGPAREKYSASVYLNTAYPDAAPESVIARYLDAKGDTAEIIVADSHGRRPSEGVMLGGRVFAVRFLPRRAPRPTKSKS